ncbi:glyoxylate/hydroxypyruvate reductase A (plasmid) [Lichenicola cladoniae]|uniref:Glyoxylate/hydroxypyruvate reductase A n=1 Tax=Lichenicola cladoniae TaxID=1484109 RepID=A0A6M8HXT4_9PROT|nr:glyoxylate/hydroxypyruvate reductase A [Lichenicola cladoniae]NPD70149.1 glyoxylate/hydroxypyruvate reductase A [Acetobacteraceae bacterium]QKE93007.1 glyoxylate/hydroxypyruvate reductase A [Lichenicola cladoniae]
MKTILVMLRAHADDWVRLLKLGLPEHAVVTDASAADGPLSYAVVGKPPAGAIAALGRLDALFSVNAGIEALLESGEVPDDMPLVRMVDDGLAAGMLEWVIAETLAWHRNLFHYRAVQLEQRWAPLQEKLAFERTVCVLGAGHLGRPVAEQLASLGFITRTWSRGGTMIPGVDSFRGPDGLAASVDNADFLINLLPLTPETETLLDAALLRRLAPGAVLINGGRGRHVVDEAVIALLDEGHLRAAVLDVFRTEPLPSEHPFWSHPGVYLSPHVAAPTHPATAVASITQNIRGFESGLALRHVVDRARGY